MAANNNNNNPPQINQQRLYYTNDSLNRFTLQRLYPIARNYNIRGVTNDDYSGLLAGKSKQDLILAIYTHSNNIIKDKSETLLPLITISSLWKHKKSLYIDCLCIL